MKSKLTFYTSILSSLLLLQNPTFAAKSPHLVSQTATKTPNCEIEPEEEEGEYSPQQLQTLASRITMRVIGDNNGGSGTIIGKRGNKYLIITNSHVIQGVNSIRVQAFDGKNYSAQVVPNNNFKKFDLALLEFQSSQNYCLPDIADFIPNQEMEVLAAGFSGIGKIMFREGKINLISQSPLKSGYSIGYTSDIDQGMSGGAIINTQGTLVGINGKSAYPILNTGYVYQNGSKPNQKEIQQFRKLSWGVPIRTFLVEVNPEILTAYKLPYPKTISANVPKGEYTGWLGDLEQKAKQFTVRIDSSSQANGSGTIIAKEGDTYTVLTAAHVVCEREDATQSCGDFSYTILAPDGNEYPVDKSSIKIEAGVDLAVVKFNSSQDYQVATLANYNHNFVDLVFAAGYPKLKNNSPWRFSPGMIFDKDVGLLLSKESDFLLPEIGSLGSKSIYSLTGGYELVYTSITYGGMSGGPVLDSLGRVIGIHGRAEAEEVRDSSINGGKVQIGFSLGIPVSTFIGLLARLSVIPQKLENTRPSPLNSKQVFKSLEKAVLSAKVSTGNATASEWLERGNQLFRLGRYDEAIKAFDQVIKQKPPFAYLAYYAKCFVLSGNYKESIEACKQALEIKPEFFVAWRHLSLIYSASGQHDKALYAINEAIKIQSKNPNVYFIKGSILVSLQRYAEAEKIMIEAIKRSPTTFNYILRGRIYASQEKWNLAKADLDTAIKLNPQLIFAYTMRGDIYYNLQKWDLALLDYSKAIEINPEPAIVYNAYKNRGFVYKKQKKWDLALADFTKAIEINPKDSSAYNNRGDVYYDQQKWGLALADYSKAIEVNPEYAIAYSNRGFVYKKQKKWDFALANFTKAIEMNPEYAIAYNQRGNIYYNQQKWDLALADYTKAIKINPEYTTVYNNRGNTYYSQKKWDLALADYSKAIEINPKSAVFQKNRGSVYDKQKKWDLAIADYSKAIELNPEYAIAYNQRGDIYYSQQKWDFALADYSKAIEVNPKYATAYSNRGFVYKKQKKWDLALANFTKAIEINPEYAIAYNQRGDIYYSQQKWDLALADYSKAIEVNPKDSSPYNKRGNIYYSQQKWDLALADYNKAIEINPKDAVFYYNRGGIYYNQKKWDLALADYSKAIEINPEYATAYNKRGNIYYSQQKWDLALADFNKAIKIKHTIDFSKTIEIHPEYTTYLQQKQWNLALADYSKAIEINPEDAIAYNHRGFIYLQQKKWDLALADLNKAIQINPESASAYNNRGFVYLQQKKWNLALADLSKAIDINPNIANPYNHQGFVYLQQKKWQLALANFNKAIDINPDYAKAYNNRGNLYRNQKRWELALADYNKAIQIDSDFAEAYKFIGAIYLQKKDKQKAIENFQQAAKLFKAQKDTKNYKIVIDLLQELQK